MTFGPIGKFQILGTLGTGAHSTILHVRRSADGKQYALKVVPLDGKKDDKFREQAEHEFRVAQMVSHPNLLRIHTLETPRDWLFRVRKVHLLSEYVNGKTLDQIKGLTLPRLVQVFEKVATAIAHMHRRNVYHADLKPNNIMLGRGGVVKVIDFGLAWIKGEDKGRIQGTPEYIAPEQVRSSTVNERTDIYNFGATMYRLVTWRLPPSCVPAPGEDVKMDAKTFQRLLKPVRELKPDAPSQLCKLIESCLSFKPDQRPERMSEVQGILSPLIDELVQDDDDRLEALEL